MIYSEDAKAVERAPQLSEENGVRVEAVQLDGKSLRHLSVPAYLLSFVQRSR